MRRIMILAAGVFLLTACMKEKSVTITVENKSTLTRDNEMVEVSWQLLQEKFKFDKTKSFIIQDEAGQQIPYQVVYNGNTTPELLIFQASFKPGQLSNFEVRRGTPDSVQSLVHARFMKEYKDDISWENDRIAFRMYGPAMEIDPNEQLITGGIDLWVKSTPNLIANQWYQDDLAGIRGLNDIKPEGGDYYSVGRTLGAGAAATYLKDSLYYGNGNFKSYEILDNGPLRTVFKLIYDPYYGADSVLINETRIISLDAGSNLNKIIENYGDIKEPLQIAAGFPYYGNETYDLNAEEGYIAYAQPEDPEKGIIYLGLVSDVALLNTRVLGNQLIGLMNYQPSYMAGKGLIYYSGGGWSKGGFPTLADWNGYVKNFALRVRHPLIVSVH
ncbi:MAG: DUF4861 family protein [Bacteroidales bacterium]